MLMYFKVITPFDHCKHLISPVLPGLSLIDSVLTKVLHVTQFYNPVDDRNGHFGSVHFWLNYQISGVDNWVKLGICLVGQLLSLAAYTLWCLDLSHFQV